MIDYLISHWKVYCRYEGRRDDLHQGDSNANTGFCASVWFILCKKNLLYECD